MIEDVGVSENEAKISLRKVQVEDTAGEEKLCNPFT